MASPQNTTNPTRGGNQARKTADPKPMNSTKQSRVEPAKGQTNNNSGKKPSHNKAGPGEQRVAKSNPGRKDTRTKTDDVTKLVERFKMTTLSEYSDKPGSTTSVSTLVTVTQTRHERQQPNQNTKAINNTNGRSAAKNLDQKPHQKNQNEHGKPNKPSAGRSAGPNNTGNRGSEKNPKPANSAPFPSANNSTNNVDKKPKPSKPQQQQLRQPNSSNKPTTSKPNSTGPSAKSRNPTDSTTTRKEQVTYLHKFDHSKASTPSNVQSQNQDMNRSMVLANSNNTSSRTLSNTVQSTPNQSSNLPTMSLPSLVSVPQILQLHHQATSAAHKGFVKVQVSKKITTSNQSR
ncbi:hypothetical protein MJO28_010496 [Puccinia striiformis f. sp. tritici]|uniref:Uncharacterized protein n=3 Tax=Puccinia striiformis TaxID=27350 RepID=A0A2S4W9F3_9BASI|nr:hypothetical protein Pst134EA_019309 [Puccinia striiformis f. sp. tritici]POW16460.1 hypothetical protein PSTT_01297 [Puccinia striiformis]KAH9449381.1 hypothetical protein Pst134EB_020207 [Puccinia striiformis f. sp. tritici]KAH9459155.1 hypothetical protein Pst134EA_019309 [Puccinia striiformis f. sp. tritici]KAI7944801.1 hypothetical protein MJO28_010496 [Puccinia striiformis f. sp. tritici]KAI7948581.1 hypothetical protein MJO29_010246 [Puccinia striiformis f. sp. tritici]